MEYKNAEDFTYGMREILLEIENAGKQMVDVLKENEEAGNKSESIAQGILALRHIEDARMRYGKVLQYLGDGESKYNK